MSFFHRVNKHRLNLNLSLIFLFCLHRAIYLTTSLETPQNTNNRMLIVRKIIVLFSIALIKFIHSFDVDIDIEQSKPLVRTFYVEIRCALLISGISKTHEKELLKTCFISISCKKKNLRLRQLLFSCNFALLY